MSHKYTQHEEDNAKIQYLQSRLGDNRVPADVLYKEAINILEGQPIDHSYDGDANIEDDPDKGIDNPEK